MLGQQYPSWEAAALAADLATLAICGRSRVGLERFLNFPVHTYTAEEQEIRDGSELDTYLRSLGRPQSRARRSSAKSRMHELKRLGLQRYIDQELLKQLDDERAAAATAALDPELIIAEEGVAGRPLEGRVDQVSRDCMMPTVTLSFMCCV